jgi:hypothetical protein
MAAGPFVCFLDHDDTLAPDALGTVLEALAPGWDVVYSDEDKLDASGRLTDSPFHKPAWSLEYLRGSCMSGTCWRPPCTVRTVGGSEFDGVRTPSDAAWPRRGR